MARHALPLFLFTVLFGLWMDYHVFILSRVKELVDGGVSTDEAVTRGIRSTASTVTAAVMVGVFAVFASLRTLDIKQMGVGLAVAVLTARRDADPRRPASRGDEAPRRLELVPAALAGMAAVARAGRRARARTGAAGST